MSEWDAELELRTFLGTSREVQYSGCYDEDIVVLVHGAQWLDGRINREISMREPCADGGVRELLGPLSIKRARQLHAALGAAIDEIERLGGCNDR